MHVLDCYSQLFGRTCKEHFAVYVIIVWFSIYSVFSSNVSIKIKINILCLFFFFKWFTNYDACTLSYIECKLRGVKKEQGILYNFLKDLISINDNPQCIYVYGFFASVLMINICYFLLN